MLNLIMPSLPVFASIAYLCAFLAGTLREHLRPPRRLTWSCPTPSPRIPWVLLRLPYQARGRLITLPYSFPLTVLLTHDSGVEVWYTCGSTAGSAHLYALNAGVAPLIEEVRVVCEFPDVFPEELPGIPPIRAIEFVIELDPGTQPISRHPYKMCPEELIELKK